MNKIRAFIAIEIPQNVKEEISNFQQILKTRETRISWPKADNIHITLKFIGDINVDSITAIAQAIESAVEHVKPFRVNIADAGAFPNLHKPRVLWIGVASENNSIKILADNIDQELHNLGYAKEPRSFKAHLTLGRVKSLVGINEVVKKMEEHKNFSCADFLVKEVVFLQSELYPTGAVYTPLKIIKL